MNSRDIHKNLFGFWWHAFFFSMTYAFTDYNTVLPSLILKSGGAFIHIGLLTFISIGFPLVFQIIFTSFISKSRSKKKFLLVGIHLRIFALAGIAFSIYNYLEGNASGFLLQVYLWMIIFTMSGAMANLSYNHLAGLSFKMEVRKKYLLYKQIFTALGMAISAIAVSFLLKSFVFPENYMYLFLAASVLLLMASGGFWILKEKKDVHNGQFVSLTHLLKNIFSILRQYPNLRYLILIANSLGVFLGFIPFIMGIVKNQFGLTFQLVGSIVLFQYASMILSTFLWKQIIHKKGYKGLLTVTIFLSGLLPLLVLLFLSLSISSGIFILFFFLGSVISAYRISMEGALLEISTDENRVLFSGILGAMNFLGALIPLIGGILFHIIPYYYLFGAIVLISLSSYTFLQKMECPAENIK